MRPTKQPIPLLSTIVGMLWLAAAPFVAHAAAISPDLERAITRRGTHADTAVILRFVDAVDLAPLAVADRRSRDTRLMVALKARAARNRASIEPLLAAHGAVRIKDLWMINGVAVTVPAIAVKQLAAHPGITRIELDSFVQGGRSQRTPPPRAVPFGDQDLAAPEPARAEPAVAAAAFAAVKPDWNIAAVHAPELWALGHTGRGVVVATMDTGVDLGHPDLRRKWRGGKNSWFDPHGQEATPYDAMGHGTQALGVIVGNASMGVAPDARWIGVRLYNGAGQASMSDIHLAFQWLMDPDGDPATVDAPDVVNASWALTGRGAGTCIMEFHDDIQALRSAGIAVVFAAGNDGPMPRTSNSPGNNPGVISVGALDRDLEVARQTSRGPSSCDGAAFPRLLAPGVNVRTTDLSHGGVSSYTTVSGSSLAAPHVSGVLALLAGAFPSASVAELEGALLRGPQNAAVPGKDNAFVRVDALAAFKALADAHGSVANGVPASVLKK
jgi:bacillopeptidase F